MARSHPPAHCLSVFFALKARKPAASKFLHATREKHTHTHTPQVGRQWPRRYAGRGGTRELPVLLVGENPLFSLVLNGNLLQDNYIFVGPP